MTEPIEKQISFHAFSGDKKLAALSKNDDVVYIYKTNGSQDTSTWEQQQVVTEHGGRVSGIDWCPINNLIVTCGHDRNAYVWKYEEDQKAWKPTLVHLRVNRSAICVKWSPRGDKFAVGTGAKCVPVCFFDPKENWWISKMIKKHKSSVIDLAWSPNQKFLVTGGSDFKCRVFSAFTKDTDTMDDDGCTNLWDKKNSKVYEFGECLLELDEAKAWVQGVAWSPNGLRIAYAGHGSTLTFVHLNSSGKPVQQTIYQKCLPTTLVSFFDDKTLVAAGFDFNPTVYEFGGNESALDWSEKRKLDKEGGDQKAVVTASSASAARNVFQDRDTRGKAADSAGLKEEPPIKTLHQNCILDLKVTGKNTFTTSGVDGRIVHWTL